MILDGIEWWPSEDMDRSGDQLLASISGSLFDWSRAWGLTFIFSFLPVCNFFFALFFKVVFCIYICFTFQKKKKMMEKNTCG